MGNSLSSFNQPVQYMVGPVLGLAAVTYSAVGAEYWEATDEPNSWITLIHLGCVSINFGSQLWHNYIASPTMFRTLSRYHFGKIQSELFPRIFTLNSVTSAVCLSTFLSRHPLSELSDTDDSIQFYALVISLLSNVTEALFLIPLNNQLVNEVNRIEKDHNLTDESAKKCNPTWVTKHAQFMRWHGVSMGLSAIGFLGTGVYMYYLAKTLRDL